MNCSKRAQFTSLNQKSREQILEQSWSFLLFGVGQASTTFQTPQKMQSAKKCKNAICKK